MALYTTEYFRKLGEREVRNKNQSVRFILESANNKHTSFDIFLSHSFLDKEVILGASIELKRLGYTVYVDWMDDAHLDRKNVTKETVDHIRKRMVQCRCLFYATTANANKSKWMSWELGFMDGFRGKCAILPMTDYIEKRTFEGMEFLSAYPYVFNDQDTFSRERLYIKERQKLKVLFDNWLKAPHQFKNQLLHS